MLVALEKNSHVDILIWRIAVCFPQERACAVEFFHKPSCKYRDNKSFRIISRFNIAIMAKALANTTEIKSRPARRAYASSVSVFADYYLASHRRSHRLWWGYEHEDSTKLVDIASGHEILKCCKTFKLYLARLCSQSMRFWNVAGLLDFVSQDFVTQSMKFWNVARPLNFISQDFVAQILWSEGDGPRTT